MSKVIDFKANKCKAKLDLRCRKKTDAAEAKRLADMTFMDIIANKIGGIRGWTGSLMVSCALVLLIVLLVPSPMGIAAASIVSAGVLFYMTNKEDSPAIREVCMLLGWTIAVLALNKVYPLENLRGPLGAILSGLMIASFYYLYTTTPRTKENGYGEGNG